MKEGSLKVFMRERFWLQAKKIVDVAGNPRRPVMSEVPEVIEGEEHCACCICKRKRQKTSNGSAGKSIPTPILQVVEEFAWTPNIVNEYCSSKVLRYHV